MSHAARAFSPLDSELELLSGRLSPNLAEAVTRLGLSMPFRVSTEILSALTGVRLTESMIRRVTLKSGRILVALEEKAVELLEKEAPTVEASAPRLQLSVDGAMVPLRRGAWAEARTLVVAALGCEDSQLRADTLSYFSRMSDHATFSRMATIETHRRGVEKAELVLAINDGAEWIQETVDLHRPDAVRILDWAHASSHVHDAGHAFFGEGCGAWCEAQLAILRHGEPIDVIVELARLADTLDAEHPAQATVAQNLIYLAKRYDQIQYAAYSARGYPIGSGIVESANRTVVQARLKGAGMHWAPSSVNPILALRSAACSDRWSFVWPRIAAQHRHADCYRRRCRRVDRAAAAQIAETPPTRTPDRPPRMVNGRPTKDHPYNRHPAVKPRRAKL